MDVLATGPGYTRSQLDALAAAGMRVTHVEVISDEELLDRLPATELYILGGDERLDRPRLERARRLRHIALVGSGYGNFIDVQAAREFDIRLSNTAGIAAASVAEHALALLLALSRQVLAHNARVKHGGPEAGTIRDLGRMTVGVVGLGQVGTALATTLREAFRTQVLYAGPNAKCGLERRIGVQRADTAELFADADAIVLACTVEPATRYLVDDAFLANSHGLLLVNPAGAELVDPAALRRALDGGHVAAAAFDGYWTEPPPPPSDDPYGLLDYPDARFVVTPHVAAKCSDVWDGMVERAVANALDAHA